MNTPSQEIYNEMKSIATQVWSSYDNTYGGVAVSITLVLTLPKFLLGMLGCWQIGSWLGDITNKLTNK